MTCAGITKGKGIEGLVSSTTPETVEPISTRTSDRLEAALMMIEDALNWPVKEFDKTEREREYVRRRGKHNLVLSPAEINYVATSISPASEREAHAQSLVINRLIQVSYDHGYNDFKIDLGFPDFSCFYIVGAESKPLNIHITGEAAFTCGQNVHNYRIELNCSYASFIGGGNHNTITFNGIFDVWEPCTYFTFKSSNCDTLNKIEGDMAYYPNNRIIRILPDGTEKIIRDTNDR